jgi:polar amino acid transport system substrate-binding protein
MKSVTKKVLSIVLIAVLGFSVLLTGCATPSAKLIEEGKLIVGSDCDYPPFISLEGTKVQGFEYELMQAIGEELGLEVVYLPPQNFDTIVASVAAGTKMDVGVSSLTITPERQKEVSFSDPYIDSNQAVVVLKTSTYTKVSDLANLRVGAQSGTTGADWVKENLPNATLITYAQTSEALAALQAGKVDAIVFDEPVAAWQVKTTYTNAKILEAIPTGEQYGIAVAKDNPGLLADINAALKTLRANGTFDRIYNKYF